MLPLKRGDITSLCILLLDVNRIGGEEGYLFASDKHKLCKCYLMLPPSDIFYTSNNNPFFFPHRCSLVIISSSCY